MYGRKYQQGVNVITAVAMTSFHILAVAAFFYIDAGAIATAIALYFVAACSASGWPTTGSSPTAAIRRRDGWSTS
jgi:hypothetical protein